MFYKLKRYIKIYIVLSIIMVTSGCSVLVKNIHTLPDFPTADMCKKPSNVLTDLQIKSISELKNTDDEKINKLVLEAYISNKTDYVECYKSLVVTKTRYIKLNSELKLNN